MWRVFKTLIKLITIYYDNGIRTMIMGSTLKESNMIVTNIVLIKCKYIDPFTKDTIQKKFDHPEPKIIGYIFHTFTRASWIKGGHLSIIKLLLIKSNLWILHGENDLDNSFNSELRT